MSQKPFVLQSFKQLNLLPAVSRAIEEMGFEKPSEIQAAALPILLGDSTDFIGLAATGTGKTAAFGIPLLERLDPLDRTVQAIILCPTRELALQVSGQIDLLGKYVGVKSTAIYGGAPYNEQINAIRRGAQVVVGTPGRVVDHLERGTLDLSGVSTVILDEADEMISMGFKDDLESILGAVNGNQEDTDEGYVDGNSTRFSSRSASIWLFSATMSREVRRVSETYLVDPRQVQINRTEMLPATLQQLYYATSESNKPEVLCKLIDAAEEFYGIVFCQTKLLVVDLVQYLMSRGYAVDALHGDMDQKARERTMKAFREKKATVLVCTDVAARGLDVKDITHVINYSLPRELDSYVHRIGRTARSGKAGYAMSLVTPSHRGLVGRIERETKSKMIEGKIPTRKEIGVKKISAILERLDAQETHTKALELMDPALVAKIAKAKPEEIAAQFLVLMLPEIFAERAEKAEAQEPRPIRVLGSKPRREGDDRGESSRSSFRNSRRGDYDRGDRGDRGDRREDSRPRGFGKRFDRPEGNRETNRDAPRDKIKRWGQPRFEARVETRAGSSFESRKGGGIRKRK